MRLLADVVKKTKRGSLKKTKLLTMLLSFSLAERRLNEAFSILLLFLAVLLDPVIRMSKDITKLILPSIFWSSNLSSVV